MKDVDHKSWCFTKEDGNMTTRIEVREITNGFIVRKNVYGHKNDDEYFDEYTETYYEENPFEDEQPDEEKEESNSTIDSLKGMMDLSSNAL